MQLSEFDFTLPEELIAHEPSEPRDACKFLVYNRETQAIEDKIFRDIIDYLEEGDVLVLNDSKVIPSRTFGKKKETGGALEVFFLEEVRAGVWKVMIRGKVSEGLAIVFEGSDLEAVVLEKNDEFVLVEVNKSKAEVIAELDVIGKAPLPPYITNNSDESEIRQKYQTVYSKEEGSVAAPTAGLHFTQELLQKIANKGVHIVYVTLHVGLGTFAPVRVDDIREHTMHAEYAMITANALESIKSAKDEGRRVMAVGTTSVRVLETVVADILAGRVDAKDGFGGWVNAFIYPGYEFQVVDGLVTNFHLPKSTLMMLISALAGRDEIMRVYEHAIEQKYKFYSFGDGMMIL
jgi:S-adenosylmethionine:tRNA ribosyltransferase-isomerase